MGTPGPKGCRLEGRRLRNLAIEHGEKRYFTGFPCIKGHIAPRHVVNGTCVECLKVRAEANPHWFLWGEHNNALKRERRKRADVKAARAAERRARQARVLQRTPKWANLHDIKRFYKRAEQLTRETGQSWHVDHVIPLCGERVSGLHVSENLQVIPGLDNIKKGAQF
jgi:hypothetical protein